MLLKWSLKFLLYDLWWFSEPAVRQTRTQLQQVDLIWINQSCRDRQGAEYQLKRRQRRRRRCRSHWDSTRHVSRWRYENQSTWESEVERACALWRPDSAPHWQMKISQPGFEMSQCPSVALNWPCRRSSLFNGLQVPTLNAWLRALVADLSQTHAQNHRITLHAGPL